MNQGGKLCVLTPIFAIDAKYITIDTDVLHSLLGSTKGTGLGKKPFGHNQELWWIKNFRLPPRLFPEQAEDRRFWFTVATDGVGASLIVQNWKWIRKVSDPLTPTEKTLLAKKQKEKRLDEIRSIAVSFTQPPTFIGLDPGIADLATTIREDDPTNKGGPSKVDHFSSGRYYHECKFKYRIHQQKKNIERSQLTDWWNGTPSLKLGLAETTLVNIEYLFASGNMGRMFELRDRKSVV